MPKRRRTANAKANIIPSVKLVGKPLPFMSPRTGETTVDKMKILRHQVIVQDLDVLRSESYHRPITRGLLTPGFPADGQQKRTDFAGGLGSGNGSWSGGATSFGRVPWGGCSGGGLLVSSGLLGQDFSVSSDPRPVTFLQVPASKRGSTAVYDFSTGGVCGGRSMPQQLGPPGTRLR